MSTPTKVIIVGAGVGGTATAARLAHAGLEVEVYEKNSFSGGRCSLIHHDGYRFDQGPSLFLLPPIFRQLYTDLGTTLEEHIDLIQCHPNYVIHYHDGESLTLSSDRAALAREVERFEGKQGVAGLEGFLKEAGIHGDQSYNLVLNQPFPSLFSLLRPKLLRNLWALHPFGSLYGRCARYFTTERLRRAFSFGSMYLGSSPFDSPGTYSLLQWSETCEGIWYPKGGFHQVVQSLIDISTSLPTPAKFNFDSAVDRVLYDDQGRAKGIRLASGAEKYADLVVVNADLVWAHNNLFMKDLKGKGAEELLNPKIAKRLTDKPHSCSSISFYWAMDSKIPALNAHNIFLAEDYKGSFDDIFKAHSMPRDPSFYVNVPSRIDPTAAPEGKDSIVVLVPTGHLHGDNGDYMKTESGKPSQNWDELVERARSQVIATLEKRLGISSLREKITWEGINTPITWKEKFNLTHGSILGITHDFFNVLSFRPQARHPTVPRAYFVGASAHPGTGVPIAIAGSRLCTEAILSDLNVPLPKTYGPVKREITSHLDVQQRRAIYHQAEDIICALLPYILGAFVAIVGMALWSIITGRPLLFDSKWSSYASYFTTTPRTIPEEVLEGNWKTALGRIKEATHVGEYINEYTLPWVFLVVIAVGAPRLAQFLFAPPVEGINSRS